MRYLLMFGLISLLGGCASFKDIISTDFAVASGEVDRTIKSVPLTSTERLIVDHAINQYLAFTEKWKDADLVERSEEFLHDFRELKKQYFSLETIVERKWREYKPAEQENLLTYQKAAISLDDTVSKLARLGLWKDVATNAATFGLVLFNMAKAL